MRMFLTSYQKTGTHQAYPMFMPNCPMIEERGHIQNLGMYEFIRRKNPGPLPTYVKTLDQLRDFDSRAFGHIAYHPEYAAAIQSRPTKVIFNYRDPRDVIVAELEMIRKHIRAGTIHHAWHNYKRFSDEIRVIDRPNPIAELIYIASIKWKNWIGWFDQDYVIPLKFEDLRLKPDETVAKLCQALKGCSLPKSPQSMVDATKRGRIPGSQVPTFRKGLVGEWKHYFTEKDSLLAKSLLGEILARMGYA
ncbi:hypothetical protein LCGC14_1259770 [marine sediment metagenome]|uniref:Sulfotransferase domain-containing protein n=1 Tax=marine sediment metagenome TaxID=412755 RepID=A0A0F9L3I8_9ZZZZ